MYDYALIVHPTSEELLYKYEPGMERKSRPLVKKVLEWMSPFKAAEIEGLNSHLGRTATGALVMCPLLMEQMVSMSPTKVMSSVVAALEFAKTLSPKIIGITAYAAFSGNKGLDLVRIAGAPLTTGACYTMSTIPEAILRGADLMRINLKEASVLVLGATSSIGKYAVDLLSYFAPRVYITAHNEDKLNLFLSELPKDKRFKLTYCREIGHILGKVNIVIVATNRMPTDFDINKLAPGTVIFDSSYPRKVPSKARDDILVIDGVSIRPPGKVNFNFDFGLPENLCYPCMAEPIILALERKFENYSLGKEVDPLKIKEIMRFAGKHGFEIAGLTSQERAISNEEIIKIRNNALKKKRR